MFYHGISDKTCPFTVFWQFWEIPGFENGVLQPRCQTVPCLWTPGPPVPFRSLKMSFLKSGEIEQFCEGIFLYDIAPGEGVSLSCVSCGIAVA